MENLIPVLILVGGLIYKIYQNYQEEMHKARQRQKQTQRKSAADPVVVQQRRSAAPAKTPAATPSYDRRLGRPQPRKIKLQPPATVTVENIQGPDLPPSEPLPQTLETAEEVVRMRQQRQRKAETKKLEVVDVMEEPTSAAAVGFDLRQAVIQSAILERPYQHGTT